MKIRAENLSKKYARATKMSSHFEAVKPLDLVIESGKLTEITGRSGSGKSTLLYMLAGLLQPTTGNVIYEDDSQDDKKNSVQNGSGRTTDLYSLSDKELSKFRNQKIGVIPQGQTGLYSLNVLQNVLAPCSIYGDGASYEKRALELLEMVGIADLKSARMTELSGGEMRRMAIARSLILDPEVIFADEPTDDLDDENTRLVLALLQKIAHGGRSVFLVTHEASAVQYADKVYKMDGGVLLAVSL